MTRSLGSQRTRIVAAVALSAIYVSGRPVVAQNPKPVAAVSADALVDSVGINIHLHYRETAYGNFENVKKALVALGVRHVRDGLVDTQWQGYYDEHNELGKLGIKGVFIVAPKEMAGLFVAYPKLVSKSFEGYEEPNEYDNQHDANWAARLKQTMALLSSAVRGSKDSFPVYGPSLVHSESYQILGNVSQYFDYGNLHNYSGGHNPGTTGWGSKDAEGNAYGGMAWQKDNLRIDSPGLPFVSTEMGFTNQTKIPESVPESVAAVYLPRLILEQWKAGARRTYLYELVSSLGEDFGLLRPDWTPKPGFFAVSNLLKLLADPGPQFQPGGLAYRVSGGDASMEQLLLQKRDGTFYLALWLEKSRYDGKTKSPVPVAEQAGKTESSGRGEGGAL